MHAILSHVPQGADFQAHKPVVLVFEGINGPAVIVLNGVVRARVNSVKVHILRAVYLPCLSRFWTIEIFMR